MATYDLTAKQMEFVRGMAEERRRLIMARGAVSVGTPRRNDDDVLGLMGEYATWMHLRLPIYQWHALWSRDLPDVGDYEIRTRSREDDPMGVNESKLRSVHRSQMFMLCYASVEYASVRIVGYARAFEIVRDGELVTAPDGRRYYRISHKLLNLPPARPRA